MTFKYSLSARLGALFLISGFYLLAASAAMAQGGSDGMMPPMAATKANNKAYTLPLNEETHPILRLTPDKSELVKLNEDASSIIVGNPAHLNVLMDNSRLLIMVPRQPGATHFTVLNEDGKVVMQRHVIIASPKEQYIRVRRSCVNGGSGCEDIRVYYCPDMCHEVEIMAGQGNGGSMDNVTAYSEDSSGAPDETYTESDDGDDSLSEDNDSDSDSDSGDETSDDASGTTEE